MAGSLADTFIQSALQQNEQARNPNAGSGFAEGAQLAFHAQQLQQQQQEIEQKKQQIQMAKLDKVAAWFETGSKMEDGVTKKAFMSGYVPNGIKALGLDDVFHPDSLKMSTSDPMLVKYMLNEVRNGRMNPSDLYAAAANPDKLAAIAADPGYKQFGGAEAIKSAVQDSIGSIDKAADERAKYNTQLATAGMRGNPLQERTILTAHDKATKMVSGEDPVLKPLQTTYQNLDNAIQNYKHGGHTPQEFMELQQAIRTNAGIKGTGGVEERAQTYAKATGLSAATWKQFLSGDIADVEKYIPEITANINKVGEIELANKRKQIENVVNVNSQKNKQFYKNHPEYAQDFQDTKSAFLDQFKNDSPNKTITFQGKQFTREALQQFVKDHPKDPNVDAVKQLLGGA